MKNLTLLIVLALFIQSIVSSQPCLPDGIAFTTQADIDNFQTNYPNCTEIGGDVIISGGYITNLNGLSGLTSIEGGLRIGFSDDGTSLINLTGLEGLTYIGGDLFIGSNNALTSLTGLDNLTFINGNFTLGVLGLQLPGGNPLLTNLTGLGSLTSIGGRLSISSNNALVSLNGLDNLETIPDLYITYNYSLASCEAQWLCDYFANPNGSINIYNNGPGCNNPLEVAGSCGITLSCLPFGNYYFFAQSDIDTFPINYPDCTEIEGDLRIDGDDITSLNGLSVLTSIGGDLIIGNDGSNNWPGNVNLTSLMGLEGLTSLGGSLNIDYNPILTSLTGLDNLNSIGEDLKINYNFDLTSLTGLGSLTSIGGRLSISSNHTLPSLTGLANIDAGSIENLFISNNTFLSMCEVQSICDYLASPNGNINIQDNATGCDNQEEVEVACAVAVDEIMFSNNLNTHPNPFSTSTTIEYELSKPGTIRITIYSQFGGQVEVIEQHQSHGLNKVVWSPKNLSNGIYYFRLQAGEQTANGKLMLMR